MHPSGIKCENIFLKNLQQSFVKELNPFAKVAMFSPSKCQHAEIRRRQIWHPTCVQFEMFRKQKMDISSNMQLFKVEENEHRTPSFFRSMNVRYVLSRNLKRKLRMLINFVKHFITNVAC